jgi:hypothetical protein
MMMAYEWREMDLSHHPGGIPKVSVYGNHVQVLDENDSVVFEWKCWDHFELEDSYEFIPGRGWLDPVHMNSTAIDFDGNIVISSRNLSECTKINRTTGEIMWRLGGKNNEFEFINDEDSIWFQHDFRPVPGKPNYYTLYDNGNRRVPRYSRAVEFYLDTGNMTAEKVWEYRHTPDRYSYWLGNVQRLPNGNTLINWGDTPLPKVTEVTPEGQVVYEADFSHRTPVYRTFRFEWEGYMLVPYLVTEPFPDRLRLLFNKFGDHSVAYYNIYGGTDPEKISFIDSTALTWMDLKDLKDSLYYYIEVTAVDTSGLESAPSNREKIYVRKIIPGDNYILNGDFSDSANFWVLYHQGNAFSHATFTGNAYRFNILNGGSNPWDIQLWQADIPLIQDQSYILEMDARADSARIIEINMSQNAEPWNNYSRTGAIYLTDQYKHFRFSFTMEDPTDLRARMLINGGGSDVNFEVKNISLTELDLSVVEKGEYNPGSLICYPNPSSRSMTISFWLDRPSRIDIYLLSMKGQLIKSLQLDRLPEGKHEVPFNVRDISGGTYIMRLKSKSGILQSKVIIMN